MAAPVLKSKFKYTLKITKGPGVGYAVAFDKDVVSIGRGPENDFVLSADPKVSRRGAEVRFREGSFVIVNLSDKNYVLVNSQEIKSEVIDETSVIQLGDSEIRFVLDQAPPQASKVESVNPNALIPKMKVVSSQPIVPPSSSPTSSVPPLSPTSGAFGGPLQQNIPNYPSSSVGQGEYRGPSAVGGYNSGMGQTSIPRQLTYSGMNPRVRFYGIIAIVAVVGYLFFSSGVKDKKTDKNAFKTTSTSLTELVEAEKRTKELLTVKKEKLDTIQYRRAQENFVKGFRDFNQGQYARARDSFQVVLNLDPENELARRYFHLSTVKFEEFIKFNMIQGNRYREKRNWRMCQSNFSNVMTMLQYLKNDPTYKEAKQYYDECTLNLEGRY